MSHLRYALLLLMLGVLPTAVHAATLYVSPSGGGSACSQAAPCGSFATALGQMRAGDTLYLRGGTYAQSIRSATMKIPSGTSYQNAVTIAGYPGETARITGNSQTLVDFSRGAGLHHIIVRDLTLDGTSQAQIHGTSGAFYAAKNSHHIRASITGSATSLP